MNIDKSVVGILSILVAVIIVATVAIPVIEDSTKEVRTLQNNTTAKFFVSEATDETVEIVATNTGTFTINGETFSNTDLAVINEGFTVRYSGTNLQVRNYKDTVWNYDISQSMETQTVTIGNGTVTTSAGKSFAYSGAILYQSSNGTYGQTDYNSNYYVDNDSIIYTDIGFIYGSASYPVNMIVSGTWDDLKVSAASVQYGGSITVLNPEQFAVKLNGATQDTAASAVLYHTSLTTTFNNGDETQSGEATKTRYFWAPIEYHTITDNDNAIISLMKIIPLLLLIVPVMMAIRMYSSRGE